MQRRTSSRANNALKAITLNSNATSIAGSISGAVGWIPRNQRAAKTTMGMSNVPTIASTAPNSGIALATNSRIAVTMNTRYSVLAME